MRQAYWPTEAQPERNSLEEQAAEQASSGTPAAPRHRARWDSFLTGVADSGVGYRQALSALAYPVVSNSLDEALEADITQGEVLQSLQKLNNGRASGALGLPAEFLRYAQAGPGGEGAAVPEHRLLSALTAVSQAAFSSGRLPADYNVGLIAPIHKKGDELDTGNYRPIAVLEPFMRLYASVLNARIVRHTEGQALRVEEQAGFRPGRSTMHNLFLLQHFADRQLARREPMYVCFLDLRAAYDRVSRLLLWRVLQRLGIGGRMLAAVQSLYSNCTVAVQVEGRVGPAQQSKTGVRQGCPLSPTLFGLFMDGLHRFLQQRCPGVGLPVQGRQPVSGLYFADDATLLATSLQDLRALVAAAGEWCDLTGMQLSVPKTKALVLGQSGVQGGAVRYGSQDIEVVQRHKVLGLWFTASEGFRNCFGPLKQSMWAAWGRVRADYGRLRCSESAWLELQLFMACVPPAGLYGAEVWGGLQLRGEARLGRLQLEAAHLRMLKMLLGLRRSTQTEVVYQESGQGPLSHTWLLRSARFWNGVARRQPSDLYHAVLQDCCRDAVVGDVHNWARGMWRALAAVGYSLQLSVVEVPVIDLACLHVKLAEAQAAKWSGLQRCPRTCASLGVMLVTYRAWFQRPQRCSADLLSLRVSPRRLRLLLRFRTGCHDLPVNVLRRGPGRVERQLRVCSVCGSGQVCDEHHLVFECAALQALRGRWPHLFEGCATMQQFMWQADLVGVAEFISEGLEVLQCV